jgi:hypothetical protein
MDVVPFSQFSQVAFLPECELNVSASHFLHFFDLAVDENFPGSQAWQFRAPCVLVLPAGQGTQSVVGGSVPFVPASHALKEGVQVVPPLLSPLSSQIVNKYEPSGT